MGDHWTAQELLDLVLDADSFASWDEPIDISDAPPDYRAALVRFGRFDEVESLGPRPAGEISAGMWDFAQGYAALRRFGRERECCQGGW